MKRRRRTLGPPRSQAGGLRYTRIVMVIGLTGLVIVALGPSLVPNRTADYFAWTIAVSAVAGLIGAGYASALPSLLWALRIAGYRKFRDTVRRALLATRTANVVISLSLVRCQTSRARPQAGLKGVLELQGERLDRAVARLDEALSVAPLGSGRGRPSRGRSCG